MDTLWGGITKLVGTTLQWLTPFGWFHSARDWMASKGYKNDPSAMIHSTLTFSAVLLLIGGFVLNLVWNINTLGSIDTRMNAACEQVREVASREKVSARLAAYMIAVDAVSRARTLRGI